MSTASSRIHAFNPDNTNIVVQTAAEIGSGHIPSIRSNDHQKVTLNIVCPMNATRQSFGSYTRVMMIWRVVNSSSSSQVQRPCDGMRQAGTKTIRIPAARAA